MELNGYIKKLCEKHGCTYVDVHSCLKQEDNTMDHSCSFDGCHPNDEGYRRISRCAAAVSGVTDCLERSFEQNFYIQYKLR